MCTQFVIIATMRFIVDYKIIYCIYIMISYFCYGGTYPVMPTLSTKLFGTKTGLGAYGIIYQAD